MAATKEDWKKDFYKNGVPTEVIVIEDTPPPSQQITQTTYTHINTNSIRRTQPTIPNLLGPPAASTRSKLTLLRRPPTTAVIPSPASCDDKDGHYIIKPNESLTPRYKMMKLLGQGTFGKVVECYDRVKRTFCAIKIIRAIPKYRDASKIEIRVLNTLKEHDPINLNKCIHLIEWFDYCNHICMVFELLGQSVFDFLKANEFRPFPIHHIQQFAKQLLTSVA
ncbi:hypothetical protein INT48_006035, partial [Thamnidium elegans]